MPHKPDDRPANRYALNRYRPTNPDSWYLVPDPESSWHLRWCRISLPATVKQRGGNSIGN